MATCGSLITKYNPYHDERGRFTTREHGLGAQALRHGGFTFSPHNPPGLAQPHLKVVGKDRGYVVATHPEAEHSVSDRLLRSPYHRARVIGAYIRKHQKLFDSNPDLHVGGWWDKSNGRFVLDIVTVKKSRAAAIRLGQQNKQDAIFDLHRGTDIRLKPSRARKASLVSKRQFAAEERRKLASEGKAMPDGSYPTPTLADLLNAIQAYGRAPESKRAQLRAYLARRARALDAPDEVMERIAALKSASGFPGTVEDIAAVLWLSDIELVETHKAMSAIPMMERDELVEDALSLMAAEIRSRVAEIADYMLTAPPPVVQVSYMPVSKLAEQRYTLAPLYAPGVVDAHGEYVDPPTLQKALWEFVRRSSPDRSVHLQHDPAVRAGEWVEAVTWPFEVTAKVTVPGVEDREVTFPPGTTYLGVVWEPWAWSLVKAGRLRGLSLGGTARKVAVDFDDDVSD